jgi:hypothetical protein
MPFITQGKTNWKFLLIVIILSIVVGVLALRCSFKEEQLYQPPKIEKSETADWKTYRNEEYGFEIKYPKEWYEKNYYPSDIVELQNIDGELYISTGGPCAKCVKDQGVRISIMVDDNPEKLPSSEYLSWCLNNASTCSYKPIKLGSIDAVQVIKSVDFGAGWPTIYISKEDKIFIISYAKTSSANDFVATFDQILSTFNFLEEIKTADFTPLKSPSSPPFIESLNNAQDVKIDLHYEGDYPGFSWPEPEFYTPAGSSEKFLSLSKLKERSGEYAYGPDYNSIFNPEGSHFYGGAPIYLLDPKSKYTVSYIGLKINNRELISELKAEFGVDYMGEQIGKSKSSIIASIFSIDTVYACGPGLYLRPVGDSNLIFVEESNGIAWYRLEKPVAIYNLSLSYCDADCSSIPENCHFWADDPSECNNYSCCEFNASISDLKNGDLRMHILYKPNDKEGFLKLQVANLILSGPAGAYYQPIMGKYFDHYYRAYLH